VARKQDKNSYHHGDLRISLINAANEMLKDGGIDALSLRKLAEKVGVSRTAAYHYFTDKNDLLCAIAEQGFKNWQSHDEAIWEQTSISLKEKFKTLIQRYITEAAANPELYDLMFGRTIWKQNSATTDLRSSAYRNFQYHLDLTKRWQGYGLLPKDEDPLRLSQVTWATMHGMARLLTDGIYADQSSIDEMCECAVNLFTKDQ